MFFEIQKHSREVFYKKAVLKNFASNILGKTLLLESLLNKVAGIPDRCFPVNIAKFLRTHVLRNICK